jgi:hypothetical protein
MTKTQTTDRSRLATLATPLLSIAIGLAYLLAGWSGGDLRFGLTGLAVMTAMAVAVLAVRRRSETVQGLLDRRDERINQIDLWATAVAGIAVIVAVIVAFIVEIARGNDGSPYTWLGALGGVAYVGAVIVQRLRG